MTVRRAAVLALLSLAAGTAAAGKPAAKPARELVLEATGGFVVDALIDGRPLRLRVDPGAPTGILLNRRFANAAGLTGLQRSALKVGPLVFNGWVTDRKVVIAGRPGSYRISWYDRDMIGDADGIVNPATLPWPVVSFKLRPAAAGERSFTFATSFDTQRGLHHFFGLGNGPAIARFTLLDRPSIVTAAAAAFLARRLGGRWAGPPEVRPVRFSVERPARTMWLAQPMVLKGLAIRSLLVRTNDHGGVGRLPEEVHPDAPEDAATVLVTAKPKRWRPPQPDEYWLMIGSDDLSRCSTMRYERSGGRLSFSCAPPPPPPAPPGAAGGELTTSRG